jgi:hypothetical protein
MDGTGALNSNGRSEPDGAVPVLLPVALTIDPVGDGWRVICRCCAYEPACVTVVTDELEQPRHRSRSLGCSLTGMTSYPFPEPNMLHVSTRTSLRTV